MKESSHDPTAEPHSQSRYDMSEDAVKNEATAIVATLYVLKVALLIHISLKVYNRVSVFVSQMERLQVTEFHGDVLVIGMK